MSYRREIRSILKEWLINWNIAQKDENFYKALENETFIITYKNGNTKRISVQDYTGEKVSRQNIKNIELINAYNHFDFNGNILDEV